MKFALLLLATLSSMISPAFAQTSDGGRGSQLGSFIDKITGVVAGLINYIVGISGSIVVIMIIYGGIQIIMGQKDPGKKTITAAVIGAVIIATSYAIIMLLQQWVTEGGPS